MADAQGRLPDYAELMKRVEQVVESVSGDDPLAIVEAAAAKVVEALGIELGLSGGRVYRRAGRHYVLQASFGDASSGARGFKVAASYPPVDAVLENRTIYMRPGDPGVDPALEKTLGAEVFAAIEVGNERGELLVAFDVGAGQDPARVLYSLGILRSGINHRLRQERVDELFREARRIQSSILPRKVPEFAPFELAGRSEPMEMVGGDFYDFIPITDKILGSAIADVSGHGLPAALQVRDIHMGLRMGMSRDFKIVRTVERLNEIIHRSTLTSRFVSLFYGELERSGTFIYVNAGHPPPFYLPGRGEVRWLAEGGAVLGPIAEATYERGFVQTAPGDLLVLYSDGIVETAAPGSAEDPLEYGPDRLVAVVEEHREQAAERIVQAVFKDVVAFGGGQPPRDDRTLVVVRHT